MSATRPSFNRKVSVDRQVKIPMRDGVNLTADVYRPKGVDQPLPVLLMRLPYGRAIASTVTYKHPSWYAMQGYIVVIQDVRGCGTAEGEFYPFRHEYNDGYDTVQWCARSLAGSNGKVGMYGFSYQGVTQFQAAMMQPPGLVTICPGMATADFYHGWFYFGGAIALGFDLGWALQLTQNRAYYLKQEPQTTNLIAAQRELDKWLNYTPLDQLAILRDEPLGQFFFDWIGNPQVDDQYWQDLNPLSKFESFDLPALHIAGWADIFIEATLNTYVQAKQHTNKPQHLVVGPWQHMPWLAQVGEIDFGEAARSHIDQLQIDWFDFWLKGIDNGIAQRSALQIFMMGQNKWRSFNHCPNFDRTSLDRSSSVELNQNIQSQVDQPNLSSNDHSAIKIANSQAGVDYAQLFLNADRQLTSTEPDSDRAPDIYVYDPRQPNPMSNYGPHDQRPTHQSWDLLVYEAEPLTTNLSIAGTPEFKLYAATNVADTDWVIKLLDIYPDGRQMLISMGVLRARFRQSWQAPKLIATEEVLDYLIKLRPTCHCWQAGHKVGIAIASAAFPLIDRHSNTAMPPHTTKVSDFIEATQQIYSDRSFPSCLYLPLLIV
ncbi:hydrolase CocE/NonD family protein [Thalassoporum mexicanum PCC 7367]|uniref:CocE/NonD family hydrolase n=1 Tax=Thalassoporum mexicanum TaxID=3457544 RepID=UPI00029F9943|nr:CocE/NonD family hydrolase [Pseudanabaena sp. PCC 7367]AFY70778.1 hydrolase CocE/NonD family protein [Pseudanabaena sp. PCC 7367]